MLAKIIPELGLFALIVALGLGFSVSRRSLGRSRCPSSTMDGFRRAYGMGKVRWQVTGHAAAGRFGGQASPITPGEIGIPIKVTIDRVVN